MGCFSYICPVCGLSIRAGEKCVLIHKRNGVLLGKTEGRYDSYGGVEEDNDFRGESGPNSHIQICVSEFSLSTSYLHGRMRVMADGRLLDSASVHRVAAAFVDANGYEKLAHDDRLADRVNDQLVEECRMRAEFDLRMKEYELRAEGKHATAKSIETRTRNILREKMISVVESDSRHFAAAQEWAESLPKWRGAASGIVAAHSLCYHNAANRDDLPFSDPDPAQGCGIARPKYR